jgi:indolepyruvate ferredoxin oxidoreductase, beta subunit
MNSINTMITGVGGQGTLLTSRILGSVALKKGFDVKVSEVHGMSQRGGSVVTYVKMGERIHSPIIDKQEADFILAFEKLEAARWMEYLKKDGIMIINTQRIDPMPVITGKVKYPEDIIEKLDKKIKILTADALDIAKECGNPKAVNMVLLGIMASKTDIGKELWLEAMKENIPGKYLEINMQAFEKGYGMQIVKT